MATSIHLIMNNPMRNTHTRFTISLCQKIKRSSITLRRLYSSHIRHGIRSYAIKIRMFQKFSGISFRRNQQNTSNRNIALASLFQYHIKCTSKILLIKIISYSPIHIRNISRLLRKMHKICNRNIYCSTADS